METYIQIIVTAICTIAYVLTFKYQTGKIGILERTLKTVNDQVSSQSKIISDFEKYKSLFDIDDFEKRLKFKLDNQSEELSALYKKEIKNATIETSKVALKVFEKENEKIFKGYEELASIAINITFKQFPNKSDKTRRDEHIRKNYPHNADYFIGFCDDYLSKQPRSNDQTE
jgi:hypothetical protein